jgi:cysteine desulfurase
MIYLDNAATTPVRPEVAKAMWPFLSGDFGNPSSHHTVGESAARALDAARARIARILGCRSGDVIFTSGGTEGDNLAIKGISLASRRGRHLIVSAVEHEAVAESADYLHRLHDFEVTVLPVDRFGLVNADDLAVAIRPETALVSVMYANNEVGTIQPIAELASVASAAGVPFHTDAVQAAGWLDCSIADLGVDALSISGHKLGAPKGVGALVVRGRIPLEPLVHGGGQERGKRSGTENVAGAVALATALELAETERGAAVSRTTPIRDAFIARVLETVPGAVLTGHPVERLPGVASFCFPGTSGEAVLLELERRSVVASSGSACAAGSDDPSAVLLAMGFEPEVAQTAVRFTLSPSASGAELDGVADALRDAVAAVAAI